MQDMKLRYFTALQLLRLLHWFCLAARLTLDIKCVVNFLACQPMENDLHRTRAHTRITAAPVTLEGLVW